MVIASFLNRQLRQVLESQVYACILVAVFAFFPYTTWLSLTLVALVTLRKGTYPGLMVVLSGMVAFLLPGLLGLQNAAGNEWTLIAYLICYFSAYLLKISENWRVVLPSLLLVTLVAIITIEWMMPAYVEANFRVFIALLQEVKPSKAFMEVMSNQAIRALMPSYLLGVQGLALVTTALFPLMLARYIQSMLFYPEGFRREILAFRAHRLALLFLVVSVLLIRQGNLVAASCLPLLALYLIVSGISLVYSWLRKRNDKAVLIMLFIPAFFLPYFVFPIYLLLGCFDSLVSVRSKKLEAS